VRAATISVARIATSLAHLVVNVVRVSAKKQVVWSDTRRRVAVMQHTHPRRNGTAMQLIGHAVCVSFVVLLAVHGYAAPQFAVSSTVAEPAPQPTAVRSNNVLLEPFRLCHRALPHSQSPCGCTTQEYTIWLVHDGLTIESYGNHGVGRRRWDKLTRYAAACYEVPVA